MALMRYLGRLTDWNDAKGYGFVEPNGGGVRAFVHVKAFDRVSRRPENGDLISYALHRDSRDRFNATSVRFANTQRRVEASKPFALPRKSIAFVFACLLAAAWWAEKIPAFVPGIYAFLSLLAFAAYARDKAAARDNTWRTPENSLHAIAIFGGWPGALVAQDVLRHKSSKPAFQWMFWFTVLVNCAVMLWLLRRQ